MLGNLDVLIVERTDHFEVKFKAVAAQPIVFIRKTLDWPARHKSGAKYSRMARRPSSCPPRLHHGPRAATNAVMPILVQKYGGTSVRDPERT